MSTHNKSAQIESTAHSITLAMDAPLSVGRATINLDIIIARQRDKRFASRDGREVSATRPSVGLVATSNTATATTNPAPASVVPVGRAPVATSVSRIRVARMATACRRGSVFATAIGAGFYVTRT